jgi:porin
MPSALYQNASKSLTNEDDAASGALRLFGRWTLLNRDTKDTGTLVFKVENRHRLGTDIPPSIRTRIRYGSWACGRGSRSDRK